MSLSNTIISGQTLLILDCKGQSYFCELQLSQLSAAELTKPKLDDTFKLYRTCAKCSTCVTYKPVSNFFQSISCGDTGNVCSGSFMGMYGFAQTRVTKPYCKKKALEFMTSYYSSIGK